MKQIFFTLRFIILFSAFLYLGEQAFAQCRPSIKIDGNIVIVDENSSARLNLPLWLKAGQTLAIDQSTFSISVMEFTVTGTTLEFSQILSITAQQTVPSGKVWKVESIVKQLNPSTYTSITYTIAGSYTWKVPTCAHYICIEAWGGGGGGGGNNTNNQSTAGAGGGGAYGQECFAVTPGTSYTVVVGDKGAGGGGGGSNGGAGGSSGLTGLLTAGGGGGGGANGGGAGGTGGTSAASNNVTGEDGTTGNPSSCAATVISKGGAGANGGAGGMATCGSSAVGTAPGGGGTANSWSGSAGVAGAPGKVIITW